MTRSTRSLSAALFGVLALGLAACGASTPGDTSSSASADASEAGDEHHDEEHSDEEGHEDHDHAAGATEASARTPRLALTYDGGILVVDANTLETVADLPLEGFNRVNAAGDGRHVAVTTTGGWAVLDAGTWSEPHGDHDHYWTGEPALHEVILEAQTPAHVVVHDGLTTFFDDGTGTVTVVETSEWTDQVEHAHLHPIREYQTEHPHHGVAVATEAGELFVTRGDENARTGAMLLDANDAELAVSDECPALHGETSAEDANGSEFILVGCEDGALVLQDGAFTKIAAPDSYGRIGNAYGVDGSNAVLGDYKTDPEAGSALTQVSVIDLATDSIQAVDPFDGSGAQYGSRGLARGAEGELLVLGTDGALHVLEHHGDHVDHLSAIPVVDPWEVPEDWQAPRPALMVLDGMAYVTEPATGEIHVVDYAGGEVWKSADLGQEVIEMAGATG